MSESNHRFWPFNPRISVVMSIAILVGLIIIFVALRLTIEWPGKESETTVLIGILLFSLLPILLTLIDVFIERGGVFEYRGVKVDFSKVPKIGTSGLTVPINIGVPGQPVNDSSTMQILDALRKATGCDVVIIDLEDGQAWWETRLLVLLAGAVRLKKPAKVVFLGKDGGADKSFHGWGHPDELLPYLLQAHPQYLRSFHTAMAAARQWRLVEPANPANPGAAPSQPGWIQAGLATRHQWMAFDNITGLPNELLNEQLLASELGEKVESEEGARRISLVRLEDLFRPVLHKEAIDESWSAQRQFREFFDSDSDYIAVTQNGKYSALVSKLKVLNTVVRTLVEKK
jgi:hypothetical protein